MEQDKIDLKVTKNDLSIIINALRDRADKYLKLFEEGKNSALGGRFEGDILIMYNVDQTKYIETTELRLDLIDTLKRYNNK